MAGTAADITAIAALVGGNGTPTSRVAPGVAPLSFATGSRYLASDIPTQEYVALTLAADTFYLGPVFTVREDVTFTKIAMVEDTAGAAGTTRFAFYNPTTLARVSEVGNITFAGGLGAITDKSTSALTISLTKGQRLRPGWSASAAIKTYGIRPGNNNDFISINHALVAEQGIPSWVTLAAAITAGNTGLESIGGTQAFTYTGTTTPTTAAPTSALSIFPALFLSK